MNERNRVIGKSSLQAAPVKVEISIASGDWPPAGELRNLARLAVEAVCAQLDWPAQKRAVVSLLFADDATIANLNAAWRGKDGPTNVLSFPAGFQAGTDGDIVLGDIALAFETVMREAGVDSKRFDHHLSHLIIHGFLHLCGYDHIDDDDAGEMESLEIGALARLDIPDPYALTQLH